MSQRPSQYLTNLIGSMGDAERSDRCETCAAWAPTPVPATREGDAAPGACHHDPPPFPTVDAKDWCRQWEAIPEAPVQRPA